MISTRWHSGKDKTMPTIERPEFTKSLWKDTEGKNMWEIQANEATVYDTYKGKYMIHILVNP